MGFSVKALFTESCRQRREIRRDDNQIRVESIYRVDVTVHGQAADQTIRPEGFTGRDDSLEVRSAP